MKTLVRYDAARSALEACVAVDEVKDWANAAAAAEAYARQAKDKDMRKMAIDIRMRAKKRLGELMAAQKLARGRPSKRVGRQPITLAEAGIDKNLAHEARIAAAMAPEAFEAAIEAKKAAVDHPDFARTAADAELLDLAAEAMTIVDADDRLKAAMVEIAKAKTEVKTISALYDSVKGEVAAFKRDATRWMKKAKKSATCKACKVALERDDE